MHGRRGRITAAVAFDQAKSLEFYEGLIKQAAPFPPDFRTVDQPGGPGPVPAEIPDQTTLRDQATVVVTGHDPSERRARADIPRPVRRRRLPGGRPSRPGTASPQRRAR